MKKRQIARLSALSIIVILGIWIPLSCLAYPEPPINSGWAGCTGAEPTIDGTITVGEWDDAAIRGFTFEMRSRFTGALQKTLDAIFYVENNLTHAFAAVEIFNDDYEAQNFANNYTGLALLFDDEHDGVLSGGENGEGVTTYTLDPFYSNNDIYWDGVGSQWAPDTFAGQTNDGALAWSHTNPVQGAIGNWTFEMIIPLVGTDGDAYDFAITTLPKTVGFKIWFQEPSKGSDGVYPDDPSINQNILETSNGATFGDLTFHPLYTLTITTTPGGSTTPPWGDHQYCYGTIVDVLATPSLGYVFDHWELDTVDVGAANPISVTMDSNHTLHAVFIYGAPAVGGNSVSLAKADSTPKLACYIALLAIPSAIVIVIRRKKK
jgi:hypothetical protein